MRNSGVALLIVFSFSPAFASKIIPHKDISYAGAFSMPSSTQSDACYQWNHILGNITYYPSGNNGVGSLFVTGKTGCPTIAEITIPDTKIGASYSSLNVSTILQPFTDIGNGDLTGLPSGANTERGIGDIVVVGPAQGLFSEKLMVVTHKSYVVGTVESRMLATVNTNFSSSVGHSGWWQITTDGSTTVNPAEYQHYIFTTPTTWAAVNTGGKSIIVGANRQNTGGSFGPTMYAVELGWGSSPPANGTNLMAKKLVSYGSKSNMRRYLESNNPPDMTWVKAGAKDAIVASFSYMQRNRIWSDSTTNDWQKHPGRGWYYGLRHPEGSGSKGYHGEPYHSTLMFYDPAEIASATNPSEVQPYAFYDISSHLYRAVVLPGIDGDSIGGIAYDENGHRLFLVEAPSNETGSRAIVHVFNVADNAGNLDTTPPTTPKNLTITSHDETHAALSWTGSTDTETEVAYIIYVNGFPTIRTRNTSFNYTYIDEWMAGLSGEEGWNPMNLFCFKVVAQDSYQNQSDPSQTLCIHFATGNDGTINNIFIK